MTSFLFKPQLFQSRYLQFRSFPTRPFWVGCGSVLALALGWVPGVCLQSGQWTIAPHAYAQTVPSAIAQAPTPPPISASEIQNYARAALMIENARRQLIEEIGSNQILGISCGDVAQISNIDEAIRNSCEKFEQFVERNNLSNARFNTIHQRQTQDPELARSILTEMARICLETQDELSPEFCREAVRVEMNKQCEAQGSQIAPQVCDRLRNQDG